MWFERYLSLEGLFAQIVTDSMAPGSDSVPVPFARVVYTLGAVIHPIISDGFIAQRLVSELLKRKVPEWNPNPNHKICQKIHFSAHFPSQVFKSLRLMPPITWNTLLLRGFEFLLNLGPNILTRKYRHLLNCHVCARLTSIYAVYLISARNSLFI